MSLVVWSAGVSLVVIWVNETRKGRNSGAAITGYPSVLLLSSVGRWIASPEYAPGSGRRRVDGQVGGKGTQWLVGLGRAWADVGGHERSLGGIGAGTTLGGTRASPTGTTINAQRKRAAKEGTVVTGNALNVDKISERDQQPRLA